MSGFSDIVAETEEQLLPAISDIPSVQHLSFNKTDLSCATLAVVLECWNRYLCLEKKCIRLKG